MYKKLLKAITKGDYDYHSTIEGIEYFIPNDEREYIIAFHHESKQVMITDFYEMDDFYEGSDYNCVVYQGKLMSSLIADDLVLEAFQKIGI